MHLQLVSQCGSTSHCLSRSIPEIHSHVAGTLSNQPTNKLRPLPQCGSTYACLSRPRANQCCYVKAIAPTSAGLCQGERTNQCGVMSRRTHQPVRGYVKANAPTSAGLCQDERTNQCGVMSRRTHQPVRGYVKANAPTSAGLCQGERANQCGYVKANA